MSAHKLGRMMLAIAFCAGADKTASAIGPFHNPQTPVAAAVRPRTSQNAQPAAQPASFQVGSAAPGALPGASPATLWRFMGIPQGIQKVRGATTNRRGNLPGREPTPPLKAIADPKNLDPGNGPAINKAAQIKQQEDLAPQKIKALKYLATIGCGCYPGVEEAFAKSLKFGDECTEEVRYEAAKAMRKAAENNCAVCGKSCCCTAEMMQLLQDVATGKDDDGCFFEPSPRVREAACEALLACRRRVRVYPAPVVPPSGLPVPGPQEYIPREPTPQEVAPRSARTQGDNGLMDDILGTEMNGGSSAGNGTPATNVSTRNSVTQQTDGDESAQAGSNALLGGTVVGVDTTATTLDVEFQGRLRPTVGSQFSVHHDYALSSVYLGRVEIVYRAANGRFLARPVGRFDLSQVHRGDRISGRITDRGQTTPEETAVKQTGWSAASLTRKTWFTRRPAEGPSKRVWMNATPATAVNEELPPTTPDEASDESNPGVLSRLFKTNRSTTHEQESSDDLPASEGSTPGLMLMEE